MGNKVTGSYKATAGDWDGMHSFESRKKDGFGGKMHTIVNEALKDFYNSKKLNPYISSIKITMDKNNYTVNWEVTIDESPDGVAYMGLTSRGGAGTATGSDGSINRAYRGISQKKKELPSEIDKSLVTTDIADFYYKFSSSGAVRQIFILYSSPKSYPNLPKSANLPNGKVGTAIGKDVGPENNAKVIQVSTVPPGTANTETVNNAGQTDTNPKASKITIPVDGTAIPTGGSFDFLKIQDSNKSDIGFISFPPRRNGSVPVLLIYPKSQNLTGDETFKLGKEEVTGKFSGIRMANKFLSWTNPVGQTADKNWIPDVTKVIGNLTKSPLESWFSKWCIVFANEPNTDFTQLTNKITEQLDFRAMKISSLNLTIFADSGNIDNSIIRSLSGPTLPFPIKTLMLLETFPSNDILEISKKVKKAGGQVYNVYNSQNFKTNITKNIIAGLSYSGTPFEESSTVLNSASQSQLASPVLFFDSVTSATISATQYNSFFGTSASNYSPFPLIPYSSLPLTLIPGSSPSQFTQLTSVRFLNNLTFTYTTLPQDLLKEGAYVYDLSKDPVENFTAIGASAGWPEVKLVNSEYVLTMPTVTPGPVISASGSTVSTASPSVATPSTATPSIPDIGVKYVLSHLQQPKIDDTPQFGFQIFYSDIEKNIGQSTEGGTSSEPKVLLSGQFTFDVRKKGYLINDQLGEFKIISKEELDIFVTAKDEYEGFELSPEYLEDEFRGSEEKFGEGEFINSQEELEEIELASKESEKELQKQGVSTVVKEVPQGTFTVDGLEPDTPFDVKKLKVPPGFNGVPLYCQYDTRWSLKPYDKVNGKKCSGSVSLESNSVASSGCGIAALSMIINYWAKKGYCKPTRPDIVAEFCSNYGGRVCNYGSNYNLINKTKFKEVFGLNIETFSNIGDELVEKCLKNGYPVAHAGGTTGKTANGANKSYKGHFLCMTGIDSEGRIRVNDSGNQPMTGKAITYYDVKWSQANTRKSSQGYCWPDQLGKPA